MFSNQSHFIHNTVQFFREFTKFMAIQWLGQVNFTKKADFHDFCQIIIKRYQLNCETFESIDDTTTSLSFMSNKNHLKTIRQKLSSFKEDVPNLDFNYKELENYMDVIFQSGKCWKMNVLHSISLYLKDRSILQRIYKVDGYLMGQQVAFTTNAMTAVKLL
ncbi:unnamed protein product [Caenorhabditis angaria]|uniref:Uncharacterized protein n=1 Tax=Caenorhabditis angaria TaxID=860376 RepID=A0A9P1I8H0_9PELO|nr:unnamed protein product [Caenorhabditis angaria]